MISFRYHVVTVVAILFALAAGLVLGHGLTLPAGTPVTTPSTTPSTSATPQPTVDVSSLRRQISQDQAFADAVGPKVVGGSLAGTSVVLVVSSDADPAIVSGLTKLLPATGATITGRIDLGSDATDPASRQLVDELTSQLAKSTKGVKVSKDLTPYERFGAVLGLGIAAQQAEGTATPATAQTLMAGLTAGHLATPQEALVQNAGLVLFVAPSVSVTDSSATGTIVASMAKGLAGQSVAVMVVAGLADGQPAAAIESIRGDALTASLVATEDSGDRSSGQIGAILGLAAAAQGTVGQYGFGASATSIVP